jgi:N-acetylglutamate synthase-like GNAT family acetyltransferase
MPKIYGTDSFDDGLRDAAAILIAQVWPGYADLFHREMEAYHAYPDLFRPYFSLAENGGGVVGFSLLLASMMSTNLLTITWVAVHDHHHRQGIGTKLVGVCMEEAQRRGNPVILTTSVPDFYQKAGFRMIEEYNPARNHFLMGKGVA